jgi:hypothetical protein
MLYREIIAVCSEIHTEHINALCGAERGIVSVPTANQITTEENAILPADREGAFLKVTKGCPKAYGNVSRSRSVGQNQDHVIWIWNACLVMGQCYS